jgi:hypothetical protein
MSNESVNYWKFATIGILLVGATVAATLLVAGRDSKTEPTSSTAQIDETPISGAAEKTAAPAPVIKEAAPTGRSARVVQSNQNASAATPPPPSYAPQAAYPPQPAYPPQSIMEACNRYANERVNSKTEEVLKNAALGAAIGAAVGAAGGAIAGGGKGAGKGAAIGGVTGVAGGALYGLNETKSRDGQYQAAYSSCMRSKGY